MKKRQTKYISESDPAISIMVENIGMGEKKIIHANGTTEKMSVGALRKQYVLCPNSNKSVSNAAKKIRIKKPKRII